MAGFSDNAVMTFSVYMKAAEHTRALVNIFTRAGVAAKYDVLFDLSAGAIVYDPSSVGTITDVGSGWYLCSTTGSVESGASTAYAQLFLDQGSGAAAPDHLFTGNASDGAYIWKPTLSLFSADKLFPPPMTTVPSAPTEPSAGSVTAGMHRLAYAVEYRSGAILRLSPDSGVGTPGLDTFTPVEFTAAGSKNLSWVLNPTTWPVDAVKVHIAMTTVANPNLYIFVPGATATVDGGESDSTTIVFDISDEDLLSNLATNDATEHRLFYTQAVGGTGPFNPHSVIVHGDRMSYLTEIDDGLGNNVGACFVSNRNNYQQITLSNHLVQIPGQLDINAQFSYRGGLYLVGPHWTYVTYDNGQDPVEWASPQAVDEQRGTLSVRGVEVSPTGDYAWVADRAGLYAFDGKYSELPVSYWQTDQWNRINWDYAYMLQVKDDAVNKRIYVLVPLDSATSPSHIFAWDYTKGIGKAEFSLWDLSGYNIGAIEMVVNDLSTVDDKDRGKAELWLAPSDASNLLRQTTENDTNPYRDDAAAISWTYRTSLLPPVAESELIRHHGGHFRVYGNGTVDLVAYNLDDSRWHTLEPITLEASPGKEYGRWMHKIGQRKSYKFSQNAVDAYCVLSDIKDYSSKFAEHR